MLGLLFSVAEFAVFNELGKLLKSSLVVHQNVGFADSSSDLTTGSDCRLDRQKMFC